MKKASYFVFFIVFSYAVLSTRAYAVNYKFYFGNKTHYKGYTKVDKSTIYGLDSEYGYDLQTVPRGNNPYFFSVILPEGNYKVTVTLGKNDSCSNTTIKSESRRLMLESVDTEKGEFVKNTFIVNVRNKRIGNNDSVKIKKREIGKLNWDNKLTLEINGKYPGLEKLEIESVSVPTIFLAGNSTVVDQDDEPWCGWGQVLPRFLKPTIAVANYAESGESARSFISSRRLAKILTKIKKDDYLFIEFGHNDQKHTGDKVGPYTSYYENLEYFIDKTREKGATPVLITPVNRRSFDNNEQIINTLGEYPNAMRKLAKEKNVMLIDLNKMTKVLYEAWGPEDSKKAFVHYPVGSFPNQVNVLEDNTHFNMYGGYQICKCVVKGLIENDSLLKDYIVEDFNCFNPEKPDSQTEFYIPSTPFHSLTKPEGD